MIKIDLAGKTALVTGGNIGIGREIALQLAEAGAGGGINYLTHSGDEVVAKIKAMGRESVALSLDASDSAQVEQRVGEAVQALGGRLDILVNNAGGLIGRVAAAEMSDEHWHKVIDVNLSSA